MSDRTVSVPPRVSVIMPTFKQARFLRRAIDSLLTQSLTDWELIVVDDGSPDDTQAILAPFLDDPRMRGIRLDTNQGLGRALNAGLDASSGTLVAYLPSDDVWYRDHLASLVDLFASQPELDPRLLRDSPPLQSVDSGTDRRRTVAARANHAPSHQ